MRIQLGFLVKFREEYYLEKRYVLDTNIIMDNPYILNEFKDCQIFIPSVVLNELDNHKNNNTTGAAVRAFSNIIDRLHETNYITDNNVKVTFVPNTFTDADLAYLGGTSNDNIIIHTARICKAEMISNDTIVRVNSRTIANIVASSTKKTVNVDEDGYKGFIETYADDEIFNALYRDKFISIKDIGEIETYPHMFIVLKKYYTESGSVVAKVNEDNTKLYPINTEIHIDGLRPINLEQTMLMNLLADEEIPLVTIIGKAGSGKTLLTTASGLSQQDQDIYNQILMTKPTIAMGEEQGFLPGNEQEKLMPWMRSYFDALEYLFDGRENVDVQQLGIKMEALTYIRGRSIPKEFIVIDEAQNLTQHEAKTIVTRAGEGAKIILMGDVGQIDNHRLNRYNNGLSYIIEAFKDQGVAGHITLSKTVRSKLADVASNIL